MYSVRVQDFEGPLDLLLFFIKRDELDIYNIPIARMTKEFLDYFHYMEQLDLEIASEFLVMAAELMQIKAKMLLPPEPSAEEEIDPRANLVKRLVEYKQMKELAEKMREDEARRAKISFRGNYQEDPRILKEVDPGELLHDVTLLDLIGAFQRAIEKMPKILVHEIFRINVTVEEQIAFLNDFFDRRPEATFDDVVAGMKERIRVIVTFLALLECIRSRRIIARQDEPYGELLLIKHIAAPDA
jgi:segregation and condensation protein A